MRTNNIGFCAVTPISAGACSKNEFEKNVITNSMKKAEDELKAASEKLTEHGIPHTPITIIKTDRHGETYQKLESDLYQASKKHGKGGMGLEEMQQLRTLSDQPLIDIHHGIATGAEHEGLQGFKKLGNWQENFKHNLTKEDTRQLVAIFGMNGLCEKIDIAKNSFKSYIFEFAERIPLEQLLKKK